MAAQTERRRKCTRRSGPTHASNCLACMAHRPATSSWLNGIMGRGRSAETGGCRRSASLMAPPSTCAVRRMQVTGSHQNCPGQLDAALRRRTATLGRTLAAFGTAQHPSHLHLPHRLHQRPSQQLCQHLVPRIAGVGAAGREGGGRQVTGWGPNSWQGLPELLGRVVRAGTPEASCSRLACHQQARPRRIIVATGCWLQTQRHANRQPEHRLRSAMSASSPPPITSQEQHSRIGIEELVLGLRRGEGHIAHPHLALLKVEVRLGQAHVADLRQIHKTRAQVRPRPASSGVLKVEVRLRQAHVAGLRHSYGLNYASDSNPHLQVSSSRGGKGRLGQAHAAELQRRAASTQHCSRCADGENALPSHPPSQHTAACLEVGHTSEHQMASIRPARTSNTIVASKALQCLRSTAFAWNLGRPASIKW